MSITQENWCRAFLWPVLYNYVWWILREASERKLRTLYFLARDGYVLREIAELFCQVYDLPIECRYLYCSRASLRTPSYHLIGEEAAELLTLGGYYVSLRSLLDRLHLTQEERQCIYQEIDLPSIDEDRALAKGELNTIRRLLKNSTSYHRYIQERSKDAYPNTIGYLKQEGLFDHSTIAIVDSGWTGSMQRSLGQLVRSEGYTGKIVGFYFGMYAHPKSSSDGTYLTWYFSKDKNLFHKIPFCNNLFECMLSAPHGMTTSYQFKDGRYEPVMKDTYQEWQRRMIQQQIQEILSYTKVALASSNFVDFDPKRALRTTYQLVKKYMGHPSKEDVERYGSFMFCDDTTEGYQMKLASAEQTAYLKNYIIVDRLIKRISNAPPRAKGADLFWPLGTVAYLPSWKRPFYRWNIYIWEFMKYVLR